VRVLQPGEQPDLALKSFGALRVPDVGSKHFDRNWPVVTDITREKDNSHPAVPELALDHVAIAEHALESLCEGIHDTLREQPSQYVSRSRNRE
jgi:hypothetical protein